MFHFFCKRTYERLSFRLPVAKPLLLLSIISCGMLLLLPAAEAQERAVDSSGKRLSVVQCLEEAKEQEALKNYRQASWFLNQAALSQWEDKNYDEAVAHFEKSISLNEKVNNEHGIVGIYSNLAMIYADKEEHEKSVEYFKKTLEGRKKKGGDKVSVISALINTSVALNNIQQYNEAAEHLEEALTLAREMNDAQQMRSCYGMLSETYEKAGNTERSIHYFNLYKTFHEMVQRDREQEYKEKEATARMRAQLAEAEKKAQEIELVYKQKELQRKKEELDKANQVLVELDATTKELYDSLDKAQIAKKLYFALKAQKEKQDELHELQLDRQRMVQYALFAGVLVVVAVAALIYRSYREKKQSNRELSEKNQEILAQRERIGEQNESLEVALADITSKSQRISQSINYAQRIQTAMMPSEEEISSIFPDHFLFFQPKDVVSGDFYWQKLKAEGQAVFTIADCTGHGVPGALVSMLGMSQLDQIVEKSEGLDPGDILTKLNLSVRNSLTHGRKQANDGMDISMVVLDRDKKVLKYAGAKNPLAYLNAQGELQVINGDRMPIGGQEHKREKSRVFTTHEIPLEEIHMFYLYSDGYQDQFGGPMGRKFMSKNFKNILQEIATLPMKDQQERLALAFNDWRREHDQVDDVSVFGARPNLLASK